MYYKRLLVGILRANGGYLRIDAEFFDEVDVSDGFDVMRDTSYEFSLTDDWELGEDDCGHEVIEDPVFIAVEQEPAQKVIHLRVVKQNEDEVSEH